MFKLLLLLASCYQFTVTVEPNFTVTVEQPVTQQITKTTTTKAQSRRRFISMFTQKSCGPCQNWKVREKHKIHAKYGTDAVQVIEMTDPVNIRKFSKSGISSYPTFVVTDWETGEWVGNPIIGYTPAETLLTLMGNDVLELISNKPVTSGKCGCSSACTCGCNSGGVCKCNQRTTTTQTVKSVQRVNAVPYGNKMYSGRVCNNPNCQMCNQIQRMLNYQTMSIQREPELDAGQQPTSPEVVERMLDMANLTSADLLVDIGCGDGRILIAAAKRGIKCDGIEIDPKLVIAARAKVKAAGLENMITIYEGDAKTFDTSKYTAITAYLYPELLEELSDKMKNARVVVSPYHEIPGLDMVQHDDIWCVHAEEYAKN